MDTVSFCDRLTDWSMSTTSYPKGVKYPLQNFADNCDRLESSRLFRELGRGNLVTLERLLQQSSPPAEGVRPATIVYPPGSFISDREFENRLVFNEVSRCLATSDKFRGSITEEDISFNPIFPICMVNGVGFGKPLVTPERIVGDTYAVLWPSVKEYRAVDYGSRDKIPFLEKEKKSVAVWRGAVKFEDDGTTKEVKTPTGAKQVPSVLTFVVEKDSGFKNWFKLDTLQKTIRSNLKTSTAAVVANVFDIALNHYNYHPGTKNPIDSELDVRVANVCQSELYNYQFVLCLEDSDIPSLLPFALSSGCVPICVHPPVYESVLYFGLEPWVHFVPIARDFSDAANVAAKITDPSLQEMFADIATNGKLHAQKIYEKHVRSQYTEKIVARWLGTENQ